VEQTTTNYNCTTTSDVVQGIKDSMSTGLEKGKEMAEHIIEKWSEIISDVKETWRIMDIND